jgi:bifunctional DNA-binding transcriptional regulator/antitoxin component of YhaV-PrlF toxin-antitoxin module
MPVEQTIMVRKYLSSITKANKLSDSIRVTIPKEIADEVSLDVGDILDWDWYTDKNGKKFIRAKKVE